MNVKYFTLIIMLLIASACKVDTSRKGHWLGECLVDSKCVSGLVCYLGHCHRPEDVPAQDGGIDGGLGLSLGAHCAAASLCQSGFCEDGVCCKGECKGECKSCKLGLNAGTCTSVTNDEDPGTCSGDKSCDAQGACLWSLGQQCGHATQCASGYCADGLCCDKACTDTCWACDLAQSKGLCSRVKDAEDPDTCQGLRACAADGRCRLKLGNTCTLDDNCLSSHCADGVCCNEACGDICRACNLADSKGSCSQVKSAEDPDTCHGQQICDATGACKLQQGKSCTQSPDCLNGHCVNRFCCDGACNGICQACDLAGKEGVCSAVTAAEDSDTCTGDSICNAVGVCLLKLGRTCTGSAQCASTYCRDGVCCDGPCDGRCRSCGLDGAKGQCNLVLRAEDPDTCAGTNTCDASGACKVINGFSCTAPTECLSNFCRDGVCCNGACSGSCRDCALVDHVGTCTAVTSGEDADSCTGNDTCNTQGVCLSRNGIPCTLPGQCASGKCEDQVCCNEDCRGTCKACNLLQKEGLCSAVTMAEDSGTCSGNDICDQGGACLLKRGKPCTLPTQCATGHCSDQVCCDSGCGDICKACNLSAAAGTCTVVTDGDDDSCTGDKTCDNTGLCLLKTGRFCNQGTQCASGHCRDSVCCNTSCADACRDCNIQEHVGACTAVTLKEDLDTCANDNICSAGGACLLKLGKPCGQGDQCASGKCVDRVCCDKDCTATCYGCNIAGKAGTCSQRPAMDADPPQCQGDNVCSAAAKCLSKNGVICFMGESCASAFCTDNMCCDALCEESCNTCIAGACTPVREADDSPQCSLANTCDTNGVCGLKTYGLGTGFGHTCALLSDKSILCWGANESHQLGDGSTTDTNKPTGGGSVFNALGLTSGAYHSCAVLQNRLINCWGFNLDGQLGDGSTEPRLFPVQVKNISTAVQAAAGGSHSCAVLTNNLVKCWGANWSGQLGNGGTAPSSTPVDVTGITTAIQVALGGTHSCALLSNKTVKCWGRNNYGQLGDNSNTTRPTPVTVAGITTARAIGVGTHHSCAVLDDGSVRCWGWNGSGQLGDNSRNNGKTPVTVSGLSAAEQVVGGDSHSCALLSDRTVQCWGDNSQGALGDGTVMERLTPVPVTGLASAEGLAAGSAHTCAFMNYHGTVCWGWNYYGQLGIGSTGGLRKVPAPVSGFFPMP